MKSIVWIGYILFFYCGYKTIVFYKEAMFLANGTGVYFEVAKIAGFTNKAYSNTVVFGFLTMFAFLIIASDLCNRFRNDYSKNANWKCKGCARYNYAENTHCYNCNELRERV